MLSAIIETFPRTFILTSIVIVSIPDHVAKS